MQESQPRKAITSLKILMAEDDKLNQALAKAMFKRIGCNYDVVENGAKLLEKLKQSDYDFILMDIEMPIMNGYEATLTIRNQLSEPLSKIPILAITAHGDEIALKKCFDVGMNGYLFKPIDQQELITKINAILSGEKKPTTPLNIKENQAGKKIDLENFYLSCGNNPITVKNIIKIFVAQNPVNIKNMEEHIEANDWINLNNLCHKMKAVYSLLGLSEVKLMLEQIEDDCKKSDFNIAKFKSAVTYIKQVHIDILPELEMFLTRINSPKQDQTNG